MERKLRAIRKARGLSVKELAEISGVKARSIGKYENGEHRVEGAKIETLAKLAIALGCRITDLIDDEELVKLIKKTR